VALQWDRFVARQETLDAAASDVAVVLQALRDVKTLAQFDDLELAEFTSALARVDSRTSVARWLLSEPHAIGDWRQGVARRAESCAVAAAMLYALEPYHALLSRAQPSLGTVALRLPADRVKAVMRSAVMMAWIEEIGALADRDVTERAAWRRYQAAAGPAGRTQEASIAWRRGVDKRAKAGSDVAACMLDALRARDEALTAVDRAGAPLGTLFVLVPVSQSSVAAE
jgi:hypothetical protein